MESTLHDLGQLLLKAVPTIFLLLVVHFYLKWMFFRPMADVLAKRRAATEGVRESAEAMRAKAGNKPRPLKPNCARRAKRFIRSRKRRGAAGPASRARQLEEARNQARELIHQGKQRLDAEAAAAKSQLAATTDALADQIVRTLLERSAA